MNRNKLETSFSFTQHPIRSPRVNVCSSSSRSTSARCFTHDIELGHFICLSDAMNNCWWPWIMYTSKMCVTLNCALAWEDNHPACFNLLRERKKGRKEERRQLVEHSYWVTGTSGQLFLPLRLVIAIWESETARIMLFNVCINHSRCRKPASTVIALHQSVKLYSRHSLNANWIKVTCAGHRS